MCIIKFWIAESAMLVQVDKYVYMTFYFSLDQILSLQEKKLLHS